MEWAEKVSELGAGEILLTSMDGDGTQAGYDLALTRAISEAVPIPVIASGGIGTISDILSLLPLESYGICGVIIGRALYDGKIDLSEAIRVAKNQTINDTTSKNMETC